LETQQLKIVFAIFRNGHVSFSGKKREREGKSRRGLGGELS